MSFDFVETDWLKKWARYSPKAIAFKDADTGQEYSYAALFYLSCRLASHLSSKYEIKRGDRVAILATNELEYLPLFFAIQRLAAIMVPINFRLTGREISHVLTDSAPEMLVYQRQFAAAIEKTEVTAVPEKRLFFDGESSLTEFIASALKDFRVENGEASVRKGSPSWFVPMASEHEDPCMILYTSGTTGAPKGAIISNKMIYWNSINTTLRLNLNQADVNISLLPFFHTSGWNVLLTPLVHRGAKTILLKKFDAERVLTLAEKEGATILFGVPTTMDMMARTPSFKTANLSKVRYAIVGGESMPVELIKTWQERGIPIRQGFGLTEFGPGVFSLNEEDAMTKIGSIGFPNFYVETRVIDGRGNEVKPGEVGELLLKGPVCSPGYWNNPKATAETIKDGWFYTGDLVRFDEEGYFYVSGRKKDMFISGGENVYPVEVELFIGSHPSIHEVAVIGVHDEKWGEVGKAFVSLKPGCTLTAEEVISYCAGNLAKYKIPKHVEFLPELPKGDSGKILKRKLVSPTPVSN